jgi:hypothetical protein
MLPEVIVFSDLGSVQDYLHTLRKVRKTKKYDRSTLAMLRAFVISAMLILGFQYLNQLHADRLGRFNGS